MNARTIILFIILICKYQGKNIIPILEDYEELYKTISQNEAYEPIAESLVTEEQILSYRKPVTVYSARGVAVTNSLFHLDPLTKDFQVISEDVDILNEIAPNNPFVRASVEARNQVRTFLSSICNYGQVREERFIITTIVVSVITAITVSTAASIGVSAALQSNENKITMDQLNLISKSNSLKKERDIFFTKKIYALKRKAQTLEDRLEINEQSYAMEKSLENLFQYLQLLIDPESYSYEEFHFLEEIQNKLGNNSIFKELMSANKFGVNGQVTLLTLSESETILVSDDERHHCQKSSILNKMITVMPEDKIVGKATEDKYRYSVGEGKSMYVNPKFILQQSKFRPKNTFSKQRLILADDKLVKSILPFNNTVIFVNSFSELGEMKRTCKNFTKTVHAFKNPILHLPHDCSITSKGLNISSFSLIYTLDEVKVNENFTYHYNTSLFSPLYHHEENLEVEEYQMKETVQKIFDLGERVTQEEREQFNSRDWWQKVKDKASSLFTGARDFLKSCQEELFLEPLYYLSACAAAILILLTILVYFWRKHQMTLSNDALSKIFDKK